MQNFKKITVMVLFLIILFTLTSCTEKNTVSKFNLEVEVQGRGMIVKGPEGVTYNKGTEVVLKAEPEPGWKFKKWQGSIEGQDIFKKITMNSNKQITAVFEPEETIPQLKSIDNISVDEGEKVYFKVDVIEDPKEDLDYQASGDLTQYFNQETRTFSWTPETGDTGNYEITFSVSDSDGDHSDSETVNISVGNVNHPPEFTNLEDKSVLYNGQPFDFSISATDPDDDQLNYQAYGQLSEYFDSSNHSFYWDPTESDVGEYVMTFTVSDGNFTTEKSIIIEVKYDYYTVSGKVVDNTANPQGIGDVELIVSGDFASTQSGQDGSWTLSDLHGEVTITPYKKGWSFEPEQISVTNSSNDIVIEGSQTEAVTFADSNFEEYIRDKVRIPDGPIYQADVENLTSVSPYYTTLSHLEGIEYMVSLETVEMGDHEISDLSPLSSLNKLKDLDLYQNNIKDITPLAEVETLQELDLNKNQIMDLSPLSGLIQLKILELNKNEFVDISPLANLTNLQELNLSYNSILDFQPLANLTNLEILNLRDSGILDLSPISQLTNLKELHLQDNCELEGNTLDLNHLSNLTQLRRIYLGYNRVENLDVLLDLDNLEKARIGVIYNYDYSRVLEIKNALRDKGVEVY